MMGASKRLVTTPITAMNDTGHSDGEVQVPGLAAALRALPDQLPHEHVTLGDILAGLGERTTTFVLLVFSVPAIVPTPGVPAGAIFGTALALLALRMMAGIEQFSLPGRVAMLRMSRRRVASFVNRAVPKLDRLEQRLRPRWPGLTGVLAFRLLGVVVFVMAVLITLPLPFGNMLPGLAVFLIALGLAQHDGAAVAVGLGVAVLASVVSGGLLIGGWWLVNVLLSPASFYP
jgi:hypothetical protein